MLYKLEDLQKHIGYHFQDTSLLRQALTHGSAVSLLKVPVTYQRLEFLGDRVLGLVISDALFRTFPQANEGELSNRLNSLIRCEICADVARNLNLGSYIIIGVSEERSGGRDKKFILADVMESLIGAIYCDDGLKAAQLFIECHWKNYMMDLKQPRLDAKTLLQEWTQEKKLSLPVYEIVEQEGPDHAPLFKVCASIPDEGTAFGMGTSRRYAEQMAAGEMLIKIGLWDTLDVHNE